jgi:DNA repair exonuclease SbcCD ATPase subunit
MLYREKIENSTGTMNTKTDKRSQKMKGFIALSRKGNIELGRILLIALILAAFGLTGCGGKLGKIETSTVDTAIADAEAAVAAAQAVDAPSLASDLFEAAKANLEAARTALTEKRGNDALRLAYQATADATLARMNSVNTTKNSELNASILQKEAEAEALRHTLGDKERKLARVESEISDIYKEEEQLNQKVRNLQKDNRQLRNSRETFGKQVAQLSETLEEIQGRAQRAEVEIRNYGREIAALRRKLEVAERRVKEEGHQKRAVVSEIDSLRRQLREQAQIYTEKLAQANQQGSDAAHAEYLKQKAQEARAYVDSQPPLHPAKTGRISLSAEQIATGKAALGNWERAWNAKNLSGHLAYYEPNVIADKVVIRESKEQRSKIDLQQLESELHQISANGWSKAKTATEVEGESVIGIHRLTQLATPAADENATALYNIWIREVWMHQVGNDWKIHHEIWQIYENVPNF